jgi:flagellar biosynthesis/type III secretory pathway M-ring protein FliF/YscJ
MESLKKLLAKMLTQFADLTRSQRVAVALGGVLAAVSLIWLVHWAAVPELVPLLDQDLEPAEVARIRDGLELSNQPFKLVGHKVMVRADASRQVILAQLQQQDRLPSDTSAGFDALVKESNPWISQAEHERRWAVALKHELEKVLRQYAGVRSASVFLPMNSGQPRFARTEAATKASVTLVMHGGAPVERELALAAARLVSGAVRGLPLRNVEVLDGNGTSALDWESEAAGISGLDRRRQKHERDVRTKILSQLPDPQARVGVQVELNLTDQSRETEIPSDPVPTKEETTAEETTRVRPSGQPGVQPNVAVSAGSRLADEHTSKETATAEFIPGFTRTREATPPGAIREIWAAVYISHSYLERVHRRQNPDADAITANDIQGVFEAEKPRLISQLTKLVKPQDEEHVAVDWYYDTTLDERLPVQASVMDDAFQLAQRFGPQSGLALLALLSLGMMLRMARRSDSGESFGLELGLPKEAIEAAQRAAQDVSGAAEGRRAEGRGRASDGGDGEEILEGGVQPVGQAAATEGILVAQEIDEKTVQTNKMLEQVAQVVRSDAEQAAALLEQWVQRTDAYDA